MKEVFFKALRKGFYFMDKFDLTRLIVALVVFLITIIYLVNKTILKGKIFTTRIITRVAIFGAISAVLYIVPYLKFAVPFFPSFLEIHFDEIPATIAGFAYGPLVGFLVILVKTLIKLPFSSTLMVGELTDFIYGSMLVVISSMIYKKHRNIKGALLGFLIAILIQVVASGFITTYLILDFYIFMMGFPKNAILGMCQRINPNVTNLGWPFFFYVALPFNAFKDAIIFALTFVLYKQTHKIIDKITK